MEKHFKIMKFSRAISRVRWFSSVETNVSKTISVLILRVVELIKVRTRTEMVFKTLVSTKLNHLTRLIARENFIILTRQESINSYINILKSALNSLVTNLKLLTWETDTGTAETIELTEDF
jgi:hypothetical protein